MKLLLLVSLPLLAWTNVIIAKSTLNEIARGQNTSVSSLPTIRNLKEDTTSGTSHQAGHAEERSGAGAYLDKLATKLGQKVTALVSAHNRDFETPEELFEKIDFTRAMVFRKPAFKDWALAVQKQHGKSAGDEILKQLLPKFPGFDEEVILAQLLFMAAHTMSSDERPVVSIIDQTLESLYAHWKAAPESHPGIMIKRFGLDERYAIENNALRGVWLGYARAYGMNLKDRVKIVAPLRRKALDLVNNRQPASSVANEVPKDIPETSS